MRIKIKRIKFIFSLIVAPVFFVAINFLNFSKKDSSLVYEATEKAYADVPVGGVGGDGDGGGGGGGGDCGSDCD